MAISTYNFMKAIGVEGRSVIFAGQITSGLPSRVVTLHQKKKKPVTITSYPWHQLYLDVFPGFSVYCKVLHVVNWADSLRIMKKSVRALRRSKKPTLIMLIDVRFA